MNLKRKTSIWKTKVAGDEYLGLDESMDITTVNEQGCIGIPQIWR